MLFVICTICLALLLLLLYWFYYYLYSILMYPYYVSTILCCQVLVDLTHFLVFRYWHRPHCPWGWGIPWGAISWWVRMGFGRPCGSAQWWRIGGVGCVNFILRLECDLCEDWVFIFGLYKLTSLHTLRVAWTMLCCYLTHGWWYHETYGLHPLFYICFRT